MRRINPIELACPEPALPKADAIVYDLGPKQDESRRLHRIRDLEHENALLMRVVSEIQIEITRLRGLLAAY